MQRVTDDCGRDLCLPGQPQRIVCLCPSLSETVVRLGAPLVGRTRYCIHPQPQIEAVPALGGTKNPDLPAILAQQPDLVIGEKEENRLEDVAALAAEVPVFVFNIESVSQAQAAIARLGTLLGRQPQGREMQAEIEAAWGDLPRLKRPLRVLYLIWRRPWMAAGHATYIDGVLRRCGLHNAAAERWPDERYPQFSSEELAALDCDLCLLSSEPYPFAEKHVQEVGTMLPRSLVQRVDGEMFSWYGARMLESATYLAQQIDQWRAV